MEEILQRDLIISVLCCPVCHGELTLYPELITSDDVKTGFFSANNAMILLAK